MRFTRLTILFVVLASFTVVACGDDGGSSAPDAKIFLDASVDGPPAALTGLGQRCGMGLPACPANAPGCVTFTQGATMGICTDSCVDAGTFMTNAQGQPGVPTPNPVMQDGMCTPIYTGSIGVAQCNTLVNIMPAPQGGVFQPNTSYTFVAVCGIACGAGNTCPGGLTCNTAAMRCQP